MNGIVMKRATMQKEDVAQSPVLKCIVVEEAEYMLLSDEH